MRGFMSYFAIGDIHGQLSLLKKMLSTLPLIDSDTLIFLGDYIDRGEDSKGVIDYLLEYDYPCSVIFLRGNHEDLFLDAAAERYPKFQNTMMWLRNGGTTTVKSYDPDTEDLWSNFDLHKIPVAHVVFFKSLLNYYETNDYIFVHAGCDPLMPLINQDPEKMRWVRYSFINDNTSWPKRVIFGHTIQRNGPLIMPNKIGIDTGAFSRDALTAVELPSCRFYTVGENNDY